METIFNTDAFDPARRGNAWIEALCGNYVTVEAQIGEPDSYFGYLKAAQFGAVGVSETYGAPQMVRRERHHLRNLDKDCYYLQYLERGQIGLRQRGAEFLTDRATMGLYSASEAYELDCIGTTQGRFLEIPREALVSALGGEDLPLTRAISGTSGIGRVLLQFMRALFEESAVLTDAERTRMGGELIALTAMATTREEAACEARPSLRAARLLAVKRYIEEHLADPLLSLATVAEANGISLRYLHRLFEDEDVSAADWLWQRRLETCFDSLANASPTTSITEIAFGHGYNSSAHFSAAFKARYGFSPSELRARRG